MISVKITPFDIQCTHKFQLASTEIKIANNNNNHLELLTAVSAPKQARGSIYQSLNKALPSRKCSIKASAKCAKQSCPTIA